MRMIRFLSFSSVFVTVAMLAAQPIRAQENAATTTEGYWLLVTGEEVNVRSRADMNSRVVTRVPLNSVLRAVTSEGAWHRILPPDDVFCLVSAEYVERSGDQGTVMVAVGTLRVRVGSAVVDADPEQAEVQTRLPNGTPVKIVGEQPGGWLRIAPPAGVHYFISQNYAKRITDQQYAEIGQSTDPGMPAAPARRGDHREWKPAPTSPADQATTRLPIVAGIERPATPIESTAVPINNTTTTADQNGRSWTPAPSSPQGAGQDQAAAAHPTAEPVGGGSALAADQVAVPSTGQAEATEDDKPLPASVAPSAAANTTPPSQLTPTRPGQLPRFVAHGVLRPNFTLPVSPIGLRYELVRPGTSEVVAYVEFGLSVVVNPTKIVGSYVGVAGETFIDMESEAELIRVSHITVLDMPVGARRPREPRK